MRRNSRWTPATFLVVCGILAHVFDAASGQFIIFGYVRVVKQHRAAARRVETARSR